MLQGKAPPYIAASLVLPVVVFAQTDATCSEIVPRRTNPPPPRSLDCLENFEVMATTEDLEQPVKFCP